MAKPRFIQKSLSALAFVAAAGLAPLGAQVSFSGLGFAAGATSSSALGVSADGSAVVGSGVGVNQTAFLWRNGAMVNLPSPAGGAAPYAAGVSADGATIVGYGASGVGSSNALRWPGVAAPVDLGVGRVAGVSADGAVFAGSDGTSEGSANAVRWVNGAPAPIFAGAAKAVSADGSAVVGFQGNDILAAGAVRWQNGAITPLWQTGAALAVSADGSAAAGRRNLGGNLESVYWRNGALTVLAAGDDPGGSAANGVAGDGSVAVGFVYRNFNFEAFVWSERAGFRLLKDILAGALPAGWHLDQATAISTDGNVVVGNGKDPQGSFQAWRVTGLRSVPGFQPFAPVVHPAKNRYTTPRASMTIRGTATGAMVLRVKAKIPGVKGLKKAHGTTSWRLPVSLKKKRVVVQVRAYDSYGQVSAPARVVILRKAPK